MPVYTVLMLLSGDLRQSVADREAVSTDLAWSVSSLIEVVKPAEGLCVVDRSMERNIAEQLALEQFGHSRRSDDMSVAVPPQQKGAR